MINRQLTPDFYNLGVQFIAINVEAKSYKNSIPLNKSLALFDSKTNQNLKYDGFLSNEEGDYLRISYSNDEEILVDYALQKRDHLRFVQGSMVINTVFPEGKALQNVNMDTILDKAMGRFDLSKVLGR